MRPHDYAHHDSLSPAGPCPLPALSVEIGGLVFDSRLWTPPPPPILPADSVQAGMQHLVVMKAFWIPVPER